MKRALLRYCLVVAIAVLVAFNEQPGAATTGKNEFLDLDIQQLMDITVTSVAKKEQSLADVAAAVYVITDEDIRRSGVTTVADALAMAPGIQVARISSSKWSVSARGFAGYTSNKLLVMIDGRSIYSPLYSGTFWAAHNVMLEDIKRIEVIRGPGATVWGANAVNGVINIITKQAKETQGTLIRVGTGNQEPFLGAARYGGTMSENVSGRMYMIYNEHGSNTLEATGQDGGDDWRPLQGGFRLDGNSATSAEWTLQGDVYKNDINEIVSPYWIDRPPYQISLSDNIDSQGANIVGRWRGELGDGNYLTIQGYYDQNSWDESYFNWDYHTLDIDLQYEMQLGQRQNVTLGGGYRYIDGAFDQTFHVTFPDRTDELYSAFVQDEINVLTNHIWLTLGTKYEHNDYTGNEWQPSARILWKPYQDHSLWAATARAVRTPALLEQYGRLLLGLLPTPAGPFPVVLTGSTDFKSETLWAYEAGYRWQVRENLSLDLALFYNDYDDLYVLSPNQTIDAYELRLSNGMDGIGKGCEVALDWQPDPRLSFVLMYSFLDLALTQKNQVIALADSSLIENASPRHQASLRTSIDLAENWQFNLWIRYVDQIMGWNRSDLTGEPAAIDHYVQVDANIIWKPTDGIEVMLAGQNLADNEQLQYISESYFSPTEIERGFYAKITWRL